MAVADFGEHLFQEMIELLARGHMREQDFVLPPDGRPIDAAHPLVVEEVPHDAPGLPEDLGPFLPAIEAQAQSGKVQSAVAGVPPLF